jgi:hypothetical protein
MQQFTDAQIGDARTRFDIIGAELSLKRQGREFTGLCPFHNEKSPSFNVVPEKGFYHCFGCGAHGDAIAYVMARHGMKFTDAVRHILQLPEQAPTRQAPRRDPSPAPVDRNLEKDIKAILDECTPITECTAAFIYLHLRGISIRQPGLLFHPALECWELGRDSRGDVRTLPAIVAPFTNSRDEITAVLRTWLSERVIVDGSAVLKDNRAPLHTRKKGLGIMGDGAIRLAFPGSIFGFAEGWETACSAQRLFNVPVWATGGTARLGFPGHWRERRAPAGQRPRLWVPPDKPGKEDDAVWLDERPPSVWLPREARKVVVFGDNGETGRTVANHAVEYWRRQGIKAFSRFPDAAFDDFNSQALAKLGANA